MLDLVFVTSVFWRSLAVVRNPALWKLLAIPVAVATGSLIILLLLALQPLATQPGVGEQDVAKRLIAQAGQATVGAAQGSRRDDAARHDQRPFAVLQGDLADDGPLSVPKTEGAGLLGEGFDPALTQHDHPEWVGATPAQALSQRAFLEQPGQRVGRRLCRQQPALSGAHPAWRLTEKPAAAVHGHEFLKNWPAF